MKYQIKVNYDTGSTFHSEYGRETFVEFASNNHNDRTATWENLEAAKRNLQRIQEHAEWCNQKDRRFQSQRTKEDRRFQSQRTKEVKEKIKNGDFPDWYIQGKNGTTQYDFNFQLETDDGIFSKVSCPPWIGYFETLNGGEIVAAEPEGGGLSFE